MKAWLLAVLDRHAVKLEAVIDEAVAELAGDFFLKLLDLWRVELDDFAGLHIDQVIVVLFRHFLVACATIAEIMRLEGAGVLAAGVTADFIIFKGRSWTELLSRPESDRIVVREGRAIERDVPDYAELDDLMGA